MSTQRTAVVFPGQGAQRQGMAADFVASYARARAVFEEASDVLGFDVKAVCHGDDPRLHLTAFTQPCILTAEIAMFEVLRHDHGFAPSLFAGHSLGEYTALVAAGAIPLRVALSLVHLRGTLMQRAVPPGLGAMVALCMPELPATAIAQAARTHQVDIANDNSPAQIVLSGQRDGVEKAVASLKDLTRQGMRTVWLNVSAPFHSRLMAPVEAPLREAMRDTAHTWVGERATAVASNYLGDFHSVDVDAIIDALSRQISGSVRWNDNMRVLLRRTPDGHIPEVFEVGPNKPLRGFFASLGVSVRCIVDMRTANRAFATDDRTATGQPQEGCVGGKTAKESP